jgi:hypothetical protein
MWLFPENFLSPIRTKLLSVIVLDESNSGIVKVPAIEPIFCCGTQKLGFFGFLRISLKRKNYYWIIIEFDSSNKIHPIKSR